MLQVCFRKIEEAQVACVRAHCCVPMFLLREPVLEHIAVQLGLWRVVIERAKESKGAKERKGREKVRLDFPFKSFRTLEGFGSLRTLLFPLSI